MIMSPVDMIQEGIEEKEIDRKKLTEFLKEFEKELRLDDFNAILKKISEQNSSEKLRFLADIFSEILDDNILNHINTIPTRLFSGSDITELTIPSNITTIEENAFRNCENLKKVIMPDETINIGEGIFSGCSNLEEVRLSEKLQQIPNNAFQGCSSLKKLFIPDSVKRMGYGVFDNCNPNIVIEMNRGIDRRETPDDPNPTALKTRKGTADFIMGHVKWLNQ